MRTLRDGCLTVLAGAGLLGATPAWAAEPAPPPPKEASREASREASKEASKVERDLQRPLFWVDVGVTLLAGGAWIGLEREKASLAPEACRWCDGNLNGLDRGARQAFLWRGSENTADLISMAMFGVSAAGALGLTALAAEDARHRENLLEDEVLVLEATAAAVLVNAAVKLPVGRQRPFAHFHNARVLCAGAECTRPPLADENLSFFSGHTTMAFSLATAAGTVASMRRYPMAPLVWAEGLIAATSMGYLRIAADRHYLTDVLVGAGTGALFGVAIPYLQLRFASDRAEARFTPAMVPVVTPVAGGTVVGLSGRW